MFWTPICSCLCFDPAGKPGSPPDTPASAFLDYNDHADSQVAQLTLRGYHNPPLTSKKLFANPMAGVRARVEPSSAAGSTSKGSAPEPAKHGDIPPPPPAKTSEPMHPFPPCPPKTSQPVPMPGVSTIPPFVPPKAFLRPAAVPTSVPAAPMAAPHVHVGPIFAHRACPAGVHAAQNVHATPVSAAAWLGPLPPPPPPPPQVSAGGYGPVAPKAFVPPTTSVLVPRPSSRSTRPRPTSKAPAVSMGRPKPLPELRNPYIDLTDDRTVADHATPCVEFVLAVFDFMSLSCFSSCWNVGEREIHVWFVLASCSYNVLARTCAVYFAKHLGYGWSSR